MITYMYNRIRNVFTKISCHESITYESGRSAAVWSKRFFVITSEKITYYTDSDRLDKKGEIILVGSVAKLSATRGSTKKAHYFTINNSDCGTRELYAKSKVRRQQWIDKINEITEELKEKKSMMGKLYKQGGISKNVWQERWSLVLGNCLYYYEDAKDSSPKGFLELSSAKIRDYSLKDREFCFEIVSNSGGKKGMKKYNFCVDKEVERTKWLQALNAAATYKPGELGSDAVSNPLNYIEMERGEVQLAPRITETPAVKEGKLKKKSPSLMAGWQSRYFVLRAPGELVYFDNEEDHRKGKMPNGQINLAEVIPGANGCTVTNIKEVKLQLSGRVFELQAKSGEDAQSWVDNINEWIAYLTDSGGF